MPLEGIHGVSLLWGHVFPTDLFACVNIENLFHLWSGDQYGPHEAGLLICIYSECPTNSAGAPKLWFHFAFSGNI